MQFRDPADPNVTRDHLVVPDGGISGVSMVVDPDAVPGESFLRFRLTPVAPDAGVEILPTGLIIHEEVSFGEVEDYQVLVTDRIDDVIGRAKDGSWWVGISNGDTFDEVRYGNWSKKIDWANVMVAELNGVGADDIVGWNPQDREWQTSTITTSEDGSWVFDDKVLNVNESPPATWADALVVDFDGDGIDEIVGRDASGNWFLSSYQGVFEEAMSGLPSFAVYEHLMVGDYNGDGREDIAGLRPNSDATKVLWEVITFTADGGFVSSPWESLLNNDQADYSDVLTADVTGDGRDDIVARIAGSGTWVLAESIASDAEADRFKTKGWGGSIPDEPLLDVMIGDVDADGDEDVIARTSSDRWWVKVSDGDSPSNQLFGSWNTTSSFVDVNTGDFNGDGLADVVGRDERTSTWTVGLSNGDRFDFQPFGGWAANKKWADVMVGDFNWYGTVEPPTGGGDDDGGDTGNGDGTGDGTGGNGGDDGETTPGANLQRLTPGTGDFDGDGAMDFISNLHLFSINDIVGDFAGTSYLMDSSIIDTLGIGDIEPIVSKEGTTLYPIDSAFGFYLTDFVGSEQKIRDGEYAEGWVGNLTDVEGNPIGLEVSDAETGVFKSGLPLGTWLTGLGGVTVKASTEHYNVMAEILGFDDTPANHTFTQIDLIYNEDGTFTPGPHNNVQYDASQLLSAWDDPDDERYGWFKANESSVIQDIFLATDSDGTPIYSVTFKDDGKLLFRWGTAVKRPNDIRMNVSLPLPEAWGSTGLTYSVTNANLRVNHKITNNPNDQIRPEDLENELAKGRGPAYEVVGNPNDENGFLWKSLDDDYAGDGTWYPAGTILRDSTLADPEGISSDLTGGFTNAWYTTMDRDPFEPNPQYNLDDLGVFETYTDPVGKEFPLLIQEGPRWRLQSGKFGQDLPGVDIPRIAHSRPPFTKDNIKYEVGQDTTTIINLLDGAGELANGVDLSRSDHWTGVVRNEAGEIDDERLVTTVDEDGNLHYEEREELDGSISYLTINGVWLSDEFDFSVYIKGDRKPTSLYDAQLVVEYEILVGINSLGDGRLEADIGDVEDVTYAWTVNGDEVDVDGYTLNLADYPDASVVGLLVTDRYETTGSTSIQLTQIAEVPAVASASTLLSDSSLDIDAASLAFDTNLDAVSLRSTRCRSSTS